MTAISIDNIIQGPWKPIDYTEKNKGSWENIFIPEGYMVTMIPDDTYNSYVMGNNLSGVTYLVIPAVANPRVSLLGKKREVRSMAVSRQKSKVLLLSISMLSLCVCGVTIFATLLALQAIDSLSAIVGIAGGGIATSVIGYEGVLKELKS